MNTPGVMYMKGRAGRDEITVDVLPYRREWEKNVLGICHRTGFMGESLEGTGRFDDIRLFGMLFCLYYLRYEPEHCFIARDGEGKIAGYIIGTDNTRRQGRRFAFTMMWRIVLRLFLYTRWRYGESYHEVMSWAGNRVPGVEAEISGEYPAHLHINVDREYGARGIGSLLLERFEDHMRERGVTGIHLATSNRNTTAIPFYNKKGYHLLSDRKGDFWRGIEDYHLLTMGKYL